MGRPLDAGGRSPGELPATIVAVIGSKLSKAGFALAPSVLNQTVRLDKASEFLAWFLRGRVSTARPRRKTADVFVPIPQHQRGRS